jgi:formate dehydrogenase subunit gamma
MLFIAAMLAHIYIGSIGMEGAFEAMGTGEVDLNWASEHHSLWVEEEQAKDHAASGSAPRAMPAE